MMWWSDACAFHRIWPLQTPDLLYDILYKCYGYWQMELL